MIENRTMCRVPWTQLHVTGRGACKLCSLVDDDRVFTEWREQPRPQALHIDDFDDIWNGSYMLDVRQRMLSDQQVIDCEPCYQAESKGQKSQRQLLLDDGFWGLHEPIEPMAPQPPRSVNIKLGNQCSQHCINCSSSSSTGVLNLREHGLSLNSDSTLIMPPAMRNAWLGEVNVYGRQQRHIGSDSFIDTSQTMINLKKMATGLQLLQIGGGEPMAHASMPELLDVLIDAGNWGCHVSLSTGCWIWNEDIMTRWAFFENNEIQLSIDGTGVTNDFLRRPSAWEQVSEIAERYASDTRVHDLKIFTIISALNINVLVNLLDYIRDMAHRNTRRIAWVPIMLSNPIRHQIRMLPRNLRDRAASSLVSWSQQNPDLYNQEVMDIVQRLRSIDTENDGSELRESLDYHDRLYDKMGMPSKPWRHNLSSLAEGL